MKPGDLVGVNKDSFLVLDNLPCEYIIIPPAITHLRPSICITHECVVSTPS